MDQFFGILFIFLFFKIFFLRKLEKFWKISKICRYKNFQTHVILFYLIYLFIYFTRWKKFYSQTECKIYCIFKFLHRRKKIQRDKIARDRYPPPTPLPSFRVDRLKRDIKFIQSHDGGTMVVCYHKIALYNVEYLPEQNKIWLYKFQRRFLRDRPAHL